ncbi:ATP-binding protein [Galbibacter sp. EGI 63066]|uniref:ATP-binding response regulator n=1 Tax=Galbibacter sp. EGI 63066 TaxID=2993559 RepID=UPI002248DBC9|nr:ATP-binding protein [Galbibacter sp. EGI 63066]MCX2681021.1 ATP-binding protein [Galbibacter sp. EGI 63066]
MENSKNRIPLKVFLSYLALALLVVVVGWIVFQEINSFTKAQRDESIEKNKILHIGKLLTLMYESESFARSAIQSNSRRPYANFLQKNDSIAVQIDSLKQMIAQPYEAKLLDSVNILLQQKTRNINELRNLRRNDSSEVFLEKTIEKLSNIEEQLGRLSLKDYVEDPENLDPKIKNILQQQIEIYNRYIPRDSSNSVNQATLDSIVTTSREMLQNMKEEASSQRKSLSIKENQLLQNDLTISQQLRQILTAFENEFVNNVRSLNSEREKILDRAMKVVTIAAIIGAILVILFSIIILKDSWRSQQYKKQIEASNEHNESLLKSREQLISMVSHDLRTPLSTILGYTELLKGAELNEKESHYTDRIKNASSYVVQLVDDLLDFSKLEAGKIHLEKVTFNLKNLISETAEGVQSLYHEKPIELIIDIDDKIDRLLVGDPFRIKQILSNLVGNAYKFTKDGHITVKARLKENSNGDPLISLSVVDTGIGIKKEKQKVIFEEFTQAESDIEKKFGGSGLGLTISQKLATLLGGNLYLESKEGVGSTFSFVFPAEFSEQELPISAEIHSENHTPKTAIVIDDDEALLRLNTEILERNGIKTHAFNNGKDALQNIAKMEYDFIITDIQLPSFNGFFFAETLKSDPQYQYKNQPIIAVTGRKDLDKKSYIEAGFAEFLHKPYEPQGLLDKIKKAFNNTEENITDTTKQADEKNNNNALFDLTSMQEFLNDEESMAQVLEVFIENTAKDLKALKKNIKKGELEEVRKKAHKMLSMFRQINAHAVVPHLDFMEHFKKEEKEQLPVHFKNLKKNIERTFSAVQKHLNC